MTAERTPVKICGLRDAEAAVAAANAGADYLGFVFVEGVRRQLQPEQALQIITKYKMTQKLANKTGRPKLVGLFRNQSSEFVNETAKFVGLDFAQLNGDEDDAYIARLELPVIRQVRVKEGTTPSELSQIIAPHLNADRTVILDRYDKETPGGSGRTFDWSSAEDVASKENVMLAGGLNPENVQNAIQQLSPWGIDVSSGVETDGVKDPERIRAFISAVRSRCK